MCYSRCESGSAGMGVIVCYSRWKSGSAGMWGIVCYSRCESGSAGMGELCVTADGSLVVLERQRQVFYSRSRSGA